MTGPRRVDIVMAYKVMVGPRRVACLHACLKTRLTTCLGPRMPGRVSAARTPVRTSAHMSVQAPFDMAIAMPIQGSCRGNVSLQSVLLNPFQATAHELQRLIAECPWAITI